MTSAVVGGARVGGSGGWSWRGGEHRKTGRPHVVGLQGPFECGRRDMGWSWRVPECFGSGRRPWYPPAFCYNIGSVGFWLKLTPPGAFCLGFLSVSGSRVGLWGAADSISGARGTVGSKSCWKPMYKPYQGRSSECGRWIFGLS